MLEDVGFQEILVKTHYLAEKVEKAIGKNKNVKLLYDADLIGTAQFLKKYQEIRYTTEKVPVGLTIYKNNVITHIIEGEEPISFKIKNKKLAETYRDYFNEVWNRAKK